MAPDIDACFTNRIRTRARISLRFSSYSIVMIGPRFAHDLILAKLHGNHPEGHPQASRKNQASRNAIASRHARLAGSQQRTAVLFEHGPRRACLFVRARFNRQICDPALYWCAYANPVTLDAQASYQRQC
ncbi:hypothetical protein ACFPTO_20260 [Paraburkholderia denitrificans]|uniref:Uncharacterized protein n=1 Tax=Paraburkholderia denitrificans TaxID=694025 RepID=A0ABW0JF19_9BURK